MSFYLHLTSRKNPPICVSSWQSIFCFLTFPLHKYPFIIHPPSWIDGFFPEEKQKIPCLCPTLPPKTNQKTCPLNLWNYRFFPIPQPKKNPCFQTKWPNWHKLAILRDLFGMVILRDLQPLGIKKGHGGWINCQAVFASCLLRRSFGSKGIWQRGA